MKSQANLACNNFSTSFYVVWIFNSVLERLGILGLWNGGRRLGWVFGVEHGAFIALSWWPLEGKLVLWALGSSGLPQQPSPVINMKCVGDEYSRNIKKEEHPFVIAGD